MPNSVYTAVSGLRTNQEDLNAVGNNLANLSTSGFKSQRVEFADLLYQTLSTGSTSNTFLSGTNPTQIGLGVKVGSIDGNFQQGSLQATGNPLDLAIQGNGFFVVNNGTQDLYTRAGDFGVDGQNFLVDPATGFRVQRFGTLGEQTPSTPAFQITGDTDIKIPFGTGIPGQITTTVTMQGNLSATAVGPLAQVLTTSQPFKSGGVAATAGTLLNALDDHSAIPYGGTDSVRIQGTTTNGAAVNVTVPVGAGTTLGNLVAAINTNFPGSTATINAQGNIVVTANATGPSSLAVTISDSAGNAGTEAWASHSLAATTVGKNGDTVNTAIQVYDSQGTAHNLSLVFQKQATDTWTLTGTIPAADGTVTSGTISGILFNDNGSFRQVTGSPTMSFQFNNIAAPQTVTFNFGAPNGFGGVTQFGGNSSAAATNQDGFAAGFLTSVSVGKDGAIDGIFTNGKSLPIAQLALAVFGNSNGLVREGNNDYSLGAQAGVPLIGPGLSGGRGTVLQGTLEQSNVDVALEFTNLIIAQQGFDVNAKTITISNQVLQALNNIIQ